LINKCFLIANALKTVKKSPAINPITIKSGVVSNFLSIKSPENKRRIGINISLKVIDEALPIK
jgi:hypothetical protein